MNSFSVIIAAAGSSSRMRGVDKQLAELGGVPVFVLSSLKFDKLYNVSEILLSVPKGEEERYADIARKHGVSKLKRVVAGGGSRAESIMNALSFVSEESAYIAIHDGARPLITEEDIARVFADAEEYGAAIAASAMTDTVKSSGGDGFIADTVPREGLFRAQTPQAFDKRLYLDCVRRLREKGYDIGAVTDDSRIFELCGLRVRITEVSALNLKITTRDDLALAGALIRTISE